MFFGPPAKASGSDMFMDEKPFETLQVEIERILPGGVGLAHAEGQTIFVSLAAPGDLVRVRIDRTRGKVAFASIIEIVKPSPDRIEPPCPYFGRCGGCDFQQLNYQAQLRVKVEIIRDCLHRIANIDIPDEFRILASPNEWHYRARANWQVEVEEGQLGYFERGSHVICDVAECAVLVPELQTTLEELRTELKSDSIPPAVRNIEAVVGDQGASVTPGWAASQTKNVTRKIGPYTYQFSAEAFFQINQELLVPLIDTAIGDVRGRLAIDLYCGAGLFTLPLAERFEKVIGVESNPLAAKFAVDNLLSAKFSHVKIHNAPVGSWLQEHSFKRPVDFVLLDPPRAGAETKVIRGILGLRPLRIIYVSCDPATLARDLKKLLAGGYELDSVTAFDMFPQTHHVETVAHLRATEALPQK